MKLSIISFTENGRQLSKKIAKNFPEIDVRLFSKQKNCLIKNDDSLVHFVDTSVGEWAKVQMRQRNALLFIGACGIAVRAIAPCLTDKLHDSPVLVMDERGKYVIPILSGHMGGANELALSLAEKMDMEPVITTATDINEKFAVDLFAKQNGLFIMNRERIAKVSSKVLSGEEITISIEPGHLEIEGQVPEGIRMISYPSTQPADVVICSCKAAVDSFCKPERFTSHKIEGALFLKMESDLALLLSPREYIIGMGCKKGKKLEEVERLIRQTLHTLGLSSTQIFALASISQKQKEPALVDWCQKEGISFLTYTAEELQSVAGDFQGSSFVKEQVGVDNVCERAAVKACGPGGTLVYEKNAKDGMTIAVARRKWKVSFMPPA